jgi:hypothetical protein
MPSKSQAQHNLMAMVATNPTKAKQLGIPQSVGSDFMHADKGKKFGSGGPESRADRQTINQPKTQHGKSQLFAKGGHVMAKGSTIGTGGTQEKKGLTTAKMGSVKTAAPSRDGIAERGRTKGTQVKMAGNTVGNGPLYNVKGPAMKKGGKVKR